MKIDAQHRGIRKALEAGKRLTAFDALERFGCLRLGARIYDLRNEGLNIQADLVPAGRDGKKRIAQYYLAKQQRKAV